MSRKKKFFKAVIYLTIISFISIFLSNYIIEKNADKKLFVETFNIPKNKVGLVLGTSKRISNGDINLYYKYRLEAAIKLFKSGKIEYIVISGDNGSKTYDEPTDFKIDLIKAGIPENKIFLDYAGFRTLDSVVRIKEIFGQKSITFISQKFHNERAIYLAEHFDINAIAYNAKDVSNRYGFKVKIREYLARVKVFVDIIFNVEPKFLGDKIEIK
ncbi:SanA/YdcF family protein [Polaribacter aquimarinus]|uniref:Protein SanA n=1 Tax=Polaribacter aquimarinus TaxID=2100726 RepID=A0A2U2JDM8_9FLAO|nr:ElyC/SanA/YdcF family protein [Polaribacter aquimarinus]PWG06446.1 protein SanA [Polaribacter aquimarinus]